MRTLTRQFTFGWKAGRWNVKSLNSSAENHGFKFLCCHYCVALGESLNVGATFLHWTINTCQVLTICLASAALSVRRNCYRSVSQIGEVYVNCLDQGPAQRHWKRTVSINNQMLGSVLHSKHTKIGKTGSRLKGMYGSGEETRAGDCSVMHQVLAWVPGLEALQRSSESLTRNDFIQTHLKAPTATESLFRTNQIRKWCLPKIDLAKEQTNKDS